MGLERPQFEYVWNLPSGKILIKLHHLERMKKYITTWWQANKFLSESNVYGLRDSICLFDCRSGQQERIWRGDCSETAAVEVPHIGWSYCGRWSKMLLRSAHDVGKILMQNIGLKNLINQSFNVAVGQPNRTPAENGDYACMGNIPKGLVCFRHNHRFGTN
jgi:hypothetical protein